MKRSCRNTTPVPTINTMETANWNTTSPARSRPPRTPAASLCFNTSTGRAEASFQAG